MKRMIVGTLFFLSIAKSVAAQTESGPPESAPGELQSYEAVSVYVDVVPACPRRGCWAVTSEALNRLDGVKKVDFNPAKSNLQRVHMANIGLPDPQAWESKFREYVDTASEFRGVVVTLIGTIAERDGQLSLTAPGIDPVKLRLFHRNITWSNANTDSSPERERPANRPSATRTNKGPASSDTAKVTGLLAKDMNGYSVDVQQLELVTAR